MKTIDARLRVREPLLNVVSSGKQRLVERSTVFNINKNILYNINYGILGNFVLKRSIKLGGVNGNTEDTFFSAREMSFTNGRDSFGF